MKSLTKRAPQKSYSSPRLNKLTPEKTQLLLHDSAAHGNEKATGSHPKSKAARLTLIATITTLAALWCPQRLLPAAAPGAVQGDSTVTIPIDGSGKGRIFDGVGALSEAATARFLIDYPEPYRSQILDYLFKPHYGASLQHLKVEIGGDTNSSWGPEPSHMHSRDDQNYNRGYEWWLMREARKRNPKIIIEALPFGAPGWVGNHHFYSQDMIDYEMKFINAAHDIYGIDINYVGIWNEIRYDKEWIKLLKKALLANNAAHKLDTRIVAADDCCGTDLWRIASDMKADPALLAAVDAVGIHYPPGYASSDDARNLSRNQSYVPLWDLEDSYIWPPSADPQAAAIAKMLNRNYIVGRMTALVHCTAVSAFPSSMGAKQGLMMATSPWSGHYDVEPSLWGIAHTTQFARPGWQYIDGASDYLRDAGGEVVGSFVTLKAPDNSAYSVIIETANATVPRPISFQVTNSLPTGPVHLWHSDIRAGTYFVQEPDIIPHNGRYSITLQPASIYSLTTAAGQEKGNAGTPPPDSPFPLPYSDNFENDALDKPAKYFVDVEGSFEVANCTGRPGKCLVQMVDQAPIPFFNYEPPGHTGRFPIPLPLTFLGDEVGSLGWTDYQVSVDVLMEEFGSVTLWGHVDRILPCVENKLTCWGFLTVPEGYALTVDNDGGWGVSSTSNSSDNTGFNLSSPKATRINAGYVAGWKPKTWHHLKMVFRGSAISAFIDGTPLMTNYVDLSMAHSNGMVALGTAWNKAQFDNFCLGTACP